jgi:glycosyltransferase involved in cell wall biosynthesis
VCVVWYMVLAGLGCFRPAPPETHARGPEGSMNVCVLGTHSLESEGPKVGTQHIAETLAAQGHHVVYVTAHASWVTLFFPNHRAKYLRTFRPARLNERLLQVTPVNFLPVRAVKRLEGTPFEYPVVRLNSAVERTRGRVIEDREFDLCIFSASPSMTLLPKIRAKRYLYRMNDLLAGFDGAPKSLVKFEQRVLESHPIAEVCTVNEELAARVRASHPHLKVRIVPNGVDLELFEHAEPDPALIGNRERNVIYVGSFDSWTDVDLVLHVAELLRDHTFHLYGTWYRAIPARRPPNVRVHGPIRHRDIAAKMKGCSVGLIPSGRQNARRMVEKPLKFYEYLAAGLGVAATTHAGKGLEPFAVIGDDPQALADAVTRAKAVPQRFAQDIRDTLRNRSWTHIVSRMLNGSGDAAPGSGEAVRTDDAW